MGNLSYCRFHNTEMDLKDCITALEDRTISSDEEKQKAKRMIKTFLEFCIDEGLIDFEEEYINETQIDDLINDCN